MMNDSFVPLQRQLAANRYERLLTGSGGLLRSQIAGVSRAVRLAKLCPDQHLQTIWNTGANVIGPAFFFFNLWLLQTASARGLKRLYFTSRDGQIHLKISQIICKQWGFDLECRYLYASTYGWGFPLLTKADAKKRILLAFEHPSMTLKQLSESLSVIPEGLEDLLDRRLRDCDRGHLKRHLLSDVYLEQVEARVTQASENLIGYFKQEGLFSKQPYAFVPFLWSGRSLQQMLRIIKGYVPDFDKKIIGFYFAFCNKIKFRDGQLLGFLGDSERCLHRINSIYVDMLEIFAAADHTTFRAIKNEEGKFIPVLKGDGVNENLAWGLAEQHESIVAYAREFTRFPRIEIDAFEPLAATFVEAFRMFLEEPEPGEGHAYGRFAFSSQSEDHVLKEIGPRIGYNKLLRFLFGRKVYRNREVIWIQGSFSRSFARFGKLYIWILSLRHRMRRIRRYRKCRAGES